MAINPETQYPGKIAPSTTDYPYGSARNITLPGDGTGTPWEAALVNDLFGFQQEILSRAGVVPSGTPERVKQSQYAKSLDLAVGAEFDSVATVLAKVAAGFYDPGVFVETKAYFGGWAAMVTPPLDSGDVYEIIDAGSPGARPAEDGGSILHVAAPNDSLYLRCLFKYGVFLRKFGAKGDNTADDSTAGQNFLNYLAASGQKGRLGAGKFLFNSNLNMKNTPSLSFDGVEIEGEGASLNGERGTVLIFTDASGPNLRIEAEDGTSPFINQVWLRSMQIYATNAASTGAVLRINRSQNSGLDNVYIRGANGVNQTLLELSQLVTISFRNCYLRDADRGVHSADLSGEGYTELFANVVTFDNCFFDDLTISVEATVACRSWNFVNGCTWEPAEDGTASTVYVGGFNATFDGCWFGDVNGVGTWIVATGEQLRVVNTEIKAADIAIDDQTIFTANVENCLLDGRTSAIRCDSARKSVYRNNRILLTTDNGIGIDVIQGQGHVIQENDVTESGLPTGTVAYRLALGTKGVLRDKVPNTVDTVVEDNSAGLWDIDTRNGRMQGSTTTNIGLLNPGDFFEFSIATPGALPGDGVALSPPAAIEAGLLWTAYVSAADTVTVRLHNASGAGVDPANATWKVKALQVSI